jgi:hypothetical protein
MQTEANNQGAYVYFFDRIREVYAPGRRYFVQGQMMTANSTGQVFIQS